MIDAFREIEIEQIMDAIEAQRAQNNKQFMLAWRLLHKHCRDEFKVIQKAIREGDLRISELNAKLCE